MLSLTWLARITNTEDLRLIHTRTRNQPIQYGKEVAMKRHILLLMLATAPYADANLLEVTVATNKQVYNLGEDILIDHAISPPAYFEVLPEPVSLAPFALAALLLHHHRRNP